MNIKSFLPFLSFTLIYLLFTLFELESLTSWLKPYLIPLLAFVFIKSEKFAQKKTLLVALFFSWLGDVLLLFVSINSLFFILGLIAFLLAHNTYIYLFLKIKDNKTSIFNRYLILILIYLFGFLYLLWNSLREMKIPVMIYALVISAMLFIVIQLHLSAKQKGTKIMVWGAIFFVLSDSILAVNKFHSPIYLSSFWIMSTYLTAQFLLVYGILSFKLIQKKDA
jgi:uncharacterized membrane protein YhhN